MNIPTPFKTLVLGTAMVFVSAVSLSSDAFAAAKSQSLKVQEKEVDEAEAPAHHVVLLNKADPSKPLGVAISFTGDDVLSSASEADAKVFEAQLAVIKASHVTAHEAVAKEKGGSVVSPSSATFYVGRAQARAIARSSLQGLISKDGNSFLALGYQPAIYETTASAGVSAEQATLNLSLHALMAGLGMIEKIDASGTFARANVREKAGFSCATLWPFFRTSVHLETRVRYLHAAEDLMLTPIAGEPSRPLAITSFVGLYDDVTQKALQLRGWTLILPEIGNAAHAFYPNNDRVFAYKRLVAPMSGGGGSSLAEALMASTGLSPAKDKG